MEGFGHAEEGECGYGEFEKVGLLVCSVHVCDCLEDLRVGVGYG